MVRKPFIATRIDLVDHRTLVPADYNPRHMDRRTLAVLVRSLTRFGWVLPVVANRRTGNIVGGHQRARANDQLVRGGGPRARHYAKVPVIYVDLSPPEEKALNVALNQISGDWDFFKRAAADELRQNATFAQMTRRHHQLSRGYRAPLGLPRFDFGDRRHLEKFVALYGTRILDFGCGRGQEVGWLAKLGVAAHGFEPFRRRPGTDRLDVKISRAQAEGLFAALAGGLNPDTIFCNFVLSSMAAPREREHVLTILAALCRHGAQCVVAVRSQHDVCYQQLLGNVRARKGGYLGIPDAGEPGLVVTGAGTPRQKFQKFYGEREFTRLLGRHFFEVTTHALEPKDPALVALCRRPRAWADPRRDGAAFERLSTALRFEFDLPVNGERLGLAERAEQVFGRWLRTRRRGADCA